MTAALLAGGLSAHLPGPAALWVPFGIAVLALVALDLGLFQRTPREPTTRQALAWSAVWFGLTVLFGAAVTATRGPARGVEFFTGYVVEQALSVDNLFVILLVFAQLAVPKASQRRVLVWGILGAVVLRGVLVVAGASLVARFHFLTYPLGVLLLVAAIKLLRDLRGPENEEPAAAPGGERLGRLVRRFLPVTDGFHGERFFVRRAGVLHATPLFLALVTIEAADAIFALDSIPAVFGVTTDPMIVLTSNLFAVLGLRSMFFVLAGLLDRLKYLKHGLVAILAVVGAKMVLGWAFSPPAWVTLLVVAVVLGVAAAASVRTPEPERSADDADRP